MTRLLYATTVVVWGLIALALGVFVLLPVMAWDWARGPHDN